MIPLIEGHPTMAHTVTATILTGEWLSEPCEVSPQLRLVRLVMPDDWDGAPISFSISADGSDFHDLFHVTQAQGGGWSAYEVVLNAVPPGASILLPDSTGIDVGWVRLRSGTRTRPVAQSGDRTFTLVAD
jgi:hypothetical protein